MDAETADKVLPQKLFSGNRMTALFFSTPFTSYPHLLHDSNRKLACRVLLYDMAQSPALLMVSTCVQDRQPDIYMALL